MTDPAPVIGIVLAAGRSTRFGTAKLLADLHGEPLLNHTLRCLIDGGLNRVLLVVGPDAAFADVTLTRDPRVALVVNPDPSRGMFSSVLTGLAAADAECVLALPGDMPFVKSDTVRQLLAECQTTGSPVVPTYRGRRGHPIAIPRASVEQVRRASPDTNLKDALAATGARVTEIAVDDPGVLKDVDAPDDLRGPTWGDL